MTSRCSPPSHEDICVNSYHSIGEVLLSRSVQIPPGARKMGWQTAWNSQSSVQRRDPMLNVGLKNEKEFSKQRIEKRRFRRSEDHLEVQGLGEQSELGE